MEALRSAYPEVPGSADYVMYWWERAARAVADGSCLRAGLITTNTISQGYNRQVIEQAEVGGARVVWAIPDHPWIAETGQADVRVAMTVVARGEEPARLVSVSNDGRVERPRIVGQLNSDLTGHADVPRAASVALRANAGLASVGFWLVGEGFRLSAEEGQQLRAMDAHRQLVRPLVSGRDLTRRNRGLYTIDFGLMPEEEARGHPVLFDLLRTRVKPRRDANNDPSARENWWRYGRVREALREALAGLTRYIVIPETGKHTVFQFLPTEVAAEHAVVCIALDDAFSLGILSSRVHVGWAQAAGGRLGIGNDPRYQKARCFDAFPFPDPSAHERDLIAHIADKIHEHRSAALARDEAVTMTGMYNVVAKVRVGRELTPAERKVHELAACGVLRDLHDDLDAAVAECYGWHWPMEDAEILDRLVKLHDERWAEEKAGEVGWLRPDYQVPRFAPAGIVDQIEVLEDAPAVPTPIPRHVAWPEAAVDQLAVVKATVEAWPGTAAEISSRFKGSRKALVERHLETLAILAEVRRGEDERYHAPGVPEELDVPT